MAAAKTLSLIVPVQDEWKLLERLMLRTRPYVDEAIIVLGRSPDRRARALAERWEARTCIFRGRNSYSGRLNAALKLATGDWVLRLDADELIAPADLRRLRGLISRGGRSAAYWFQRRNYCSASNLWGDWRPNRGEHPFEELASKSAGYWAYPIVRLFRRLPSTRYVFRVHEMLAAERDGSPFPSVSIAVHHLQFHRGDENDRAAQKAKARRYARLALLDMGENPGSPIPFLNRSAELLDSGASLSSVLAVLETAERNLLLSDQFVPDWTETAIRANRILAYLLHGRAEEACASIAPPPKKLLPSFLLLVGAALGKAKRWEESQLWFQRVLKTNPEHPVALNGMGLAQMALGRSKEAAELFRKARAANPRFAAARLNLRRALP